MATAGLSTYNRKRNFRVTPEPPGKAGAARGAGSFVVQKHAAKRLHYDFRLEWEGVLLSWAIPKGPSLDPAMKRMAVQVEDHPLPYGKFEGVIPKGEYGAGSVIIWDRGRWTPVGDAARGLREGKLKFTLQGEKLRGGFTLVRMRARDDERQPSWLLIKEQDEHARPSAQFDVLADRIASEYEIPVVFESAGLYTARWLEASDPKKLEEFVAQNDGYLADDHEGTPVFLARNAWHLETTERDWPAIKLLKTRE
jgi:bifunctional non-homologous end joining protein LigD